MNIPKGFGVILFLGLGGFYQVYAAYSYATEESLRSSLGIGTTYNIFVRPLANVNVTVALNIITLNSLSIADQSMKLAGYLTMSWNDQRLDWSTDSTYNSVIPSIYTNENYIWRPALIIENSINDISVVSDENVLMQVQMSGDVIWTPSGIYTTHCDTDVTYYPFDTQKCDVIVTTWGYTAIELSLIIDSNPVRLSYYKENGEWRYEGYTSYSSTNTREGASTPDVTFTLIFKRRPAFHVLNTLIPVFLLAILSALVFKLPADSGEKIGYTLTVLLAYAVYLTIISDNLPSSSKSTAILTVYLLLVLALGVISVIITILVLDVHHKDDSLPVSKWVTTLVTKCLAPVSCWQHYRCICGKKVRPRSEESKYDKKVEKEDLDEDHATPTWKDISHVLDAFFLRVYLFVILSLNFAVLISLGIGYNMG